MAKRARTPQEKKELSYAKDGRNTVAESRGTAHRAVARRKVKANRALRHAQARALAGVAEGDADVFVARTGRRSWKKVPDAPLGEFVAARLDSREAGEMNATSKQSATLAAGRKRARIRAMLFMGGFFRGQNGAAARRGDQAQDG